MHTGIISFCDRVALNIKATDVKTVIVQQLEHHYNIKILSRQFNNFDENGKTFVERFPHWMCLRSNGNPYYMWFTKYQDTNVIFYIDKKVHPGYTLPRIILGRGMFNDALFENTLLDGEMVKSANGAWVFLVNDCLAYRNKYLQFNLLPDRLRCASDIFTNHYTPHPVVDMCTFALKKYFPCAPGSQEALIDFKATLPYSNRGIYFWPFSHKYKPKLMNFDDTLIKAVVRKVKDNPDFMMALPVKSGTSTNSSNSSVSTPTSVSVSNSPIRSNQSKSVQSVQPVQIQEGEVTFFLRKTEQPDVYDIYKTADMTAKSLGVASVPTLTVSKMLRAQFKNATIAMYIPFVCTFDNKFTKWLPLRKATAVA